MEMFITWLIEHEILIPRMDDSFVYSESKKDYSVQMRRQLNPVFLVSFGVGLLLGLPLGLLIGLIL